MAATAEDHAYALARFLAAYGYERFTLHAWPDSSGKPVFWRVVLEDDAGEVTTLPLSRIGGRWRWRLPGGALPPYAADALTDPQNRECGPVVLVEHERVANRLWDRGIMATALADADRTDLAPLEPLDLALWPSNGAAGHGWAVAITQRLGRPAPVIQAGDPVAWLEAHPDAVEEILELPGRPLDFPQPRNMGKRRREVAAWLREQLAEGPAWVADVQVAAATAGISDRTLRRARKDIGARTERDGFGGPSTWSLL